MLVPTVTAWARKDEHQRQQPKPTTGVLITCNNILIEQKRYKLSTNNSNFVFSKSMKTIEVLVPKRAVLKYNICVENDRLEMIDALDEKLSHQNDRLKMIGGGICCFQ